MPKHGQVNIRLRNPRKNDYTKFCKASTFGCLIEVCIGFGLRWYRPNSGLYKPNQLFILNEGKTRWKFVFMKMVVFQYRPLGTRQITTKQAIL
ncbi:hypothetical protein XBKB1_1680003 [Xenorhabdus bovienii str. kraussei Becker Underwood]|uniref:Uncharacterized protein n=1 Tax=Xenorhabdus bovienii str. kraussei Becker Underwood TaxID=1398204 RepID=A0A077PRD1_XENBV|nr:hypothetical protein XBKB1_1680003 [Xenorhabdus bovienii str. kraussei Becker Underwood]